MSRMVKTDMEDRMPKDCGEGATLLSGWQLYPKQIVADYTGTGR